MSATYLSLLEQILNGCIRESTAALELVEGLDGRRLGLTLEGPEIQVSVTADGGRLRLERGAEAPADVTLRGTPLALLDALRKGGLGAFGGDGSGIAGDAQVAEQFAAVLRLARPDLEETLAHLTGDVVAHKVGGAVRDARGWSERAISALLMNSGEYLQEESRILPARVEVERFFAEVDKLRDAIDRVSARINRLATAAGKD